MSLVPLKAVGITKRFRVGATDLDVLKGIDFEVDPGEVVGLTGASGAGKSSVARTITRLLEPDAGEILFRGKNLYEILKCYSKQSQ